MKVTACKLEDLDGDLATTNDQSSVPMWPVYLSIGGVRQLPGATTGSQGCYTWENLQPGLSYDVEEDVLLGWYPLTDTKHDFGPSVSGGVYSFTFINSRSLGCGFTWGYWKNHNKYQNANGAHRDAGWDAIGEDTQFFGNWEEPGNTNTLTWFEILLIAPKGGNAYLTLAHQYVAAWLNINKATDPANAAALGSTMAEAEGLLTYYSNSNPAYATYPPEIPKGAANLSGDDRAWAIGLAGTLDQFNNGTLPGGPPHCGE